MTKRPLIFVGVRGDFSMYIYLTEHLSIPVLGILDKYYFGNTASTQGIPIIGSEDQLEDPNDVQGRYWKENCDFIVTSFWNGTQHLNDIGLNNEQLRIDRCNLLDRTGVNVISMVDSTAFNVPGHNVKLGRGVVIAKYVGFKRDITIGDYCEVDSYSCFGHGVTVGRNVTIGTYSVLSDIIVDDNVRVGLQVIAVGSLDNHGKPLHIGSNSTIWNGVTVFRDVPENSIVVPPMPRIITKQRTL